MALGHLPSFATCPAGQPFRSKPASQWSSIHCFRHRFTVSIYCFHSGTLSGDRSEACSTGAGEAVFIRVVRRLDFQEHVATGFPLLHVIQAESQRAANWTMIRAGRGGTQEAPLNCATVNSTPARIWCGNSQPAFAGPGVRGAAQDCETMPGVADAV